MIKNDNNRQSGAGQNPYKHKLFMWHSLVAFIIRDSFVSLGRNIAKAFKPAADRKSPDSDQGSVSRFHVAVHSIFAIVTLEGPRLMLISRYRAARMKRGTKVGISAASGTAIAAVVIVSILVGSQLIAVTVDGKIIGYVENEGQYTTLLQRTKDKVSAQVGTENTEILIDETKILPETVIVPQQQPMTVVDPAPPVAADGSQQTDAASGSSTANGSAETAGDAVSPASAENNTAPAADRDADAAGDSTSAESGQVSDPADAQAGEEALVDSLIDSLINSGAIQASVYTITVDDKEMARLATLPEASAVLNTIREQFVPAGTTDEEGITGSFVEDVAINPVTTDLNNVSSQEPEEVAAYLLTGTTDSRTYTAVADDTVENIYGALGINEARLRAEYPEYNFNIINEGDVFETTLSIPYINYRTEGVEITNEPIPFDTVDEKTDTLYLGQREIKQEGVLGERDVTRYVTRINGEIIETTEVGSTTVKEPISEIMLVGTRLVPLGDGSNAYVGPSDGFGGGGGGPLNRPLDSWYLSRSVGGAHQGADMLAPQGTPIFAADAGTVTFVGVYGGYGNLVIIDHRNGMQTYYAHCDSFNTTEGTDVQRGQQIATVGSTGRSTAYHLHFEVRINGSVQEPMDWIG